MAKIDPTADPEFQRTLKNLLSTPHKPQSEMKVGERKDGRSRKRNRDVDGDHEGSGKAGERGKGG
jgi:hypothetical protein